MHADEAKYILNRLGSSVFKKSSKGFMTNCPLMFKHERGSDIHPSLMVFAENDPTICYCHSCKFKGTLYNLAKNAGASHDVLEYISGAEGQDIFKRAKHLPKYEFIPDALRNFDSRMEMNKAIKKQMQSGEGWYFYGRPNITEDRELNHEQKKQLENWMQTAPPPYLAMRGIIPDQIKRWDIGYDPTGIMGNVRSFQTKDGFRSEYFFSHGERIVFTIKGAKGEIVGWSKRSIHDNPSKHMIPSGWMGKDLFLVRGDPKYYHCPGFSRDSYLYGMHLIDTVRSKTAIVVEGFFDVLTIDRYGIANPLAVMGGHLSDRQLRFLIDNFSNVIFLPDGDKAGIELAKNGFEKLKPFVNVKIAGWIDGKDPAEYSEQELRDLLSKRWQISLINRQGGK